MRSYVNIVPPELLTPAELDALMERAIEAADEAIERTPEGQEIHLDVIEKGKAD